LGVPEEERQKGVDVLFKQIIADGEGNEINEAQKSPSRLDPIGLYQDTLQLNCQIQRQRENFENSKI